MLVVLLLRVCQLICHASCKVVFNDTTHLLISPVGSASPHIVCTQLWQMKLLPENPVAIYLTFQKKNNHEQDPEWQMPVLRK